MVDKTLAHDQGNFLFLNGSNCEIRYKIPPTKRRLRLHRQKLRGVLSQHLDIRYGKEVKYCVKSQEGRMIVHFTDGTTEEGSLLVGADGNHSAGEYPSVDILRRYNH